MAIKKRNRAYNKEVFIGSLCMPFNVPFSLDANNKTITGGLSLPFCLPFGMDIEEEGRTKLINRYPIKETAWRFYGIVFDEYVVAKMKKEAVLLEEIKSRIMVDLFLIDKNHLKLKWTGSPVEYVQVFKKLDIDEDYEPDGEPLAWEVGETTIQVSDGSYNIMLKAPNGDGESNIIDLLDTSQTKVNSSLNIAINEKTYYFEVDFKETHKININF